jgi:L-ascorbate metabolism protein UlaG (beta-lactamase superfamily)
LFDDGASAFMTDGFFTRPRLGAVLAGSIQPDRRRISDCLTRAAPSAVSAIVPVHTHYDHALDTAQVAEQTGAVLIGGRSAANVALGHGLPETQIAAATPGAEQLHGGYGVTLLESQHCPPDRFPGAIDAPVPRRARAKAYRCGEAWSVLVRHERSGRSALVQGSAGFVAGSLRDWRADVAYLGVGQLGLQPEIYVRDYWRHTVRAVGARRVVLIHWDDFFRPLDEPLRAVPYAGDDLDVTLQILDDCAATDGVDVWLPTVWRREDPWRDL